MLIFIFVFACWLGASLAAASTVQLDNAVVTGFTQGALTKYLGIPYAYPPVGPFRFRVPQELGPYEVAINATAYGPSCPQQKTNSPFNLPANISAILKSSPNLRATAVPESEDCLTINVIKPSFVTAADKFPVIVWIYGGGFQIGSTAEYDDQAVRIVQRSVALGSPVVYVHMNYRQSAFGFLGGQEVYDEGVGNLGLVDQRVALRWVHRYIGQFGGDSSKVMLWGQSAGAISIAMQMLAYGGDTANYFHAAFMQSGATIPVGSVVDGQVYYDFLVEETGCRNSTDTLDCLRGVPYATLKDAVDKTPDFYSYQSLILAYSPRRDDLFLINDPQKLVQEGLVASIPIVSGNCDDEGTVFALSTRNITSETQFREYISEVWLPKASAAELDPLWLYYTSNLPEGSPFDTGNANGLTRQFKRMAAFQGDAVFQAPRRFFLKHLSGKQKIWSYLSKRSKLLPYLGSFHGSDIFLFHVMDDYVINFAVNHDPNIGKGLHWPEYTAESPQLYTFPALSLAPPTISLDNYRGQALAYLSNISLSYPL